MAQESVPLTRAIARGDEQAFARFYELWFDRTYALAAKISRRDESFCLDVVQDCMLKVVRSLRPLATGEAVVAWMGKAVLHTVVDQLRKEKRQRSRDRKVAADTPEHGGDGAIDHSDALELREQADWLARKLDELPAGDRELLLQRYTHGQTLAAAGEAVGITGHAAHGRIRRILQRWQDAAREYFS